MSRPSPGVGYGRSVGFALLAAFFFLSAPGFAGADHLPVDHAKVLRLNNEKAFQQWRADIPDYERRLYNRVKNINWRVLRNSRLIVIGNLVLLLMVAALFVVILRNRGKEQGETGQSRKDSRRRAWRVPLLPKKLRDWSSRSFAYMKKGGRARRAGILVAGLLLVAGAALTGSELWIRYENEKVRDFAQKVSSDSSLAYDTPGQNRSNSAGTPLMVYDYFSGFIPVANSHTSGYQTDIAWITNNGHFRYGEDFPRDKPRGEFRVFVTGGALAWGYGVNQMQLYSTLIERMFAERYGTRVRIISAGVPGYSSTQERIYLENHIMDFQPDAVVMFSGWDDTYHSFSGRPLLKDSDTLGYQRYLSDFFKIKSVTLSDNGKKLYLRNPLPNYDQYFFKTLWRIKYWAYEANTPPAYFAVPMRDVYRGVERNIRLVAAMSKAFDFGFIYYLQPTAFNTAHPVSGNEKTSYGNAKFRYPDADLQALEGIGGFSFYNHHLYNIYRKRLPELADELGIVFSDSDAAIAAEKRTVFADPVILGDRGHKLIARHLFKVIESTLLKRGLLVSG